MLIIFIIIFVSIIALCDFSSIFLDEDLEDILYYRDQEEVKEQTSAIEEVYTEETDESEELEVHDAIDATEELPYAKTVNPEDDFDSYDEDIDYSLNVDADALNEALEDVSSQNLTDTDAILQQIIQDSEII